MQKNDSVVTMSPGEQRVGLVFLALQLLVLPRLIGFSVQLLFPKTSIAEQNFAVFLLEFMAVLMLFRHFWAGSVKTLVQQPGHVLLICLVAFFAYHLMTSQLSIWIYTLMPHFSNVNDGQVGALLTQNFPLIAFCTVFLVPVVEESLYRGLIFGSLLKKSTVAAYLVSVPVFCAIHVLGYLGNYPLDILLVCFVQYIPAGICLGWAYQKSGTILAPITIHAFINALGIFSVR